MPGRGNGSEPERGEISPEDREALRRRAVEIGGRLDEVKARNAPAERPRFSPGAGYAIAFRFVADLIVGVAVGGFIGWALDRQFGSSPWLLALFLVLGFAAGLANVIRAARKMQAENAAAQRAGRSLADDDDEG